MSYRKFLSPLVAGSLTVAAAGAPAAMAIPPDLPAGAAAKAQAPVFPQTRNPPAPIRDARSPDAADPPHTGKFAPFHGPPTWPAHPTPIRHASQPAVAAGGDDGGTDWLVPGLGLFAGGLILAGGLGTVAVKSRAARSHAAHQ